MRLRESHINQLLSYLEHREDEGWYYGNRKQFETRHEELKKWLLQIRKDLILQDDNLILLE